MARRRGIGYPSNVKKRKTTKPTSQVQLRLLCNSKICFFFKNQHNFLIDSLEILYDEPQFYPLPSPPTSSLHPCQKLFKKNQTKTKPTKANKQIKTRAKQNRLRFSIFSASPTPPALSCSHCEWCVTKYTPVSCPVD